MRRTILLVLAALCLTGMTMVGAVMVLAKPAAIPTCSAANVGGTIQKFGGAGEGATKLCFCGSDGAASPAYAWCSIALTEAAVVLCTGGSATVCP